MKKANRFIRAASVLSLGVLLASCGGSPSASSEKVLRIGLECAYAPFNWTEPSSNDYTLPIANQAGSYADGYDIQMAKKIEKLTGYRVEIYATEWDSLIPDLQTNSIDAIIAGMTDTEERRLSIDFTNEYYHSDLVLVGKKSLVDTYTGTTTEEFETLLSGKKLITQTGTIEDDIAAEFAKNYNAVHLNGLSTYGAAAVDVNQGLADFVIAEKPVAQSYTATMPNLATIDIPAEVIASHEADLGVSIGIRKGDSALKDVLNGALAKISSDERNSLMAEAVARSSSLN